MTEHPDPVETLAQALAEAHFNDPAYRWEDAGSAHKDGWRKEAKDLLARVKPAIPALVAEAVAREECARTAEEYMDGEGTAAIRARGEHDA